MNDIRKQIDDMKSHIYMRNDGTGAYCDIVPNEITRTIDTGIDNFCLVNAGRIPTEEERAIMRCEIAKQLLLLDGMTEERLKELETMAEIAVEEKKIEMMGLV
jgi:hypothetical protein